MLGDGAGAPEKAKEMERCESHALALPRPPHPERLHTLPRAPCRRVVPRLLLSHVQAVAPSLLVRPQQDGRASRPGCHQQGRRLVRRRTREQGCAAATTGRRSGVGTVYVPSVQPTRPRGRPQVCWTSRFCIVVWQTRESPACRAATTQEPGDEPGPCGSARYCR